MSSRRFDWALPYASRRQPIFARQCVATSQPLATQAGIAMLARGGNAVDAALAMAIALTVVEPCSTGIGSDLFAMLWDGEKLSGLNASGRSPAAWSPSRFSGLATMPERGWDSVTIPGAVAGWQALSKRYGKLPFVDLFVPAIGYARDGYLVSPVTAEKWRAAARVLPTDLGFAEHFMPHGRAPAPGERFASAEMASTLEKIASSGGEAFYRGELAAAMAAHSRNHGGAHTVDDFAAHEIEWMPPMGQNYRDVTVHELPPNGQGIAALIALGILEHFDLSTLPPDSVESQHLQIEAMKLAFADTYRYVADRQFMALRPEALLDPAYLASRAKLIDARRAKDFGPGAPPSGGTVYLCAADADGMMVSLIQSGYMAFGSGVVVPGTGISLQNRGAGFVVEAGHPNEVAGGKRPFHTIIPGFMTRGGRPWSAFGVMGGPIQPQAHLQTTVRVVDYAMNPQAALDAPRWKLNPGNSVNVEESAAPALRAGLVALGHKMEAVADSYMDFGGGQFIVKIEGGYLAASDPRRDGQAAGL